MIGFLFEFKSLRMVPPSTVATLRTTEIVVAFVAQILLTNTSPEPLDTLGAALNASVPDAPLAVLLCLFRI